jgi:hypothetical protein
MRGPSRNTVQAVRLLPGDEAVAVGENGNICVVVWRGAVTEAPFELQRSGLAEVVARNPEGAGLLCVVERTAKPPEDTLRRASSQMIAAHGERLRCVACVIEGEGFKTAINRGALAGMVLLLRNKKTAVSVFATVREALVWMSRYLEVRPMADFAANVDYIRTTFPPPRSA